jgi:hypothetical protein
MWNQMIMSVTEAWMDYLAWLTGQGMYRDEYLTDKVILLYVLLPIIQHEIFEWVLDHNANPIRPQQERTKHVPGIPDELYRGRDYRSGQVIARQYGFTIEDRTWDQCSEECGEYNSSEILTSDTQEWCRIALSLLEISAPKASDFINRTSGKVVPYWYQCLIYTARHHYASGQIPQLTLAEKPYSCDIEVLDEVLDAVIEGQLEEEGEEYR